MKPALVSRWIQEERRLSRGEVDGYFDAFADRLLAFAFETRCSVVEPHAGNFSIKFVTSGAEQYTFQHGQATLERGRVLVVNGGQTYSSTVTQPTRAFSIFVPDDDVRAACRCLCERDRMLLARPDAPGALPEVAPLAMRQADTSDALRFARIMWSAERPDGHEVAESAAQLTLSALGVALRVAPPSALAAAKKSTTRLELMARVLRARDYIHDHAGRPVSLDVLASHACLSKFHFLRVFTTVFGMTPSGYARQLRLSRAQACLAQGTGSKAAARMARYSSPSALRRALRARHN